MHSRFLAPFLLLPAISLAELPKSVEFREGPINSVTVVKNGERLAVNHSESPAGAVLLTHARRDIVERARTVQAKAISAPEASRSFLEGADEFWTAFWDQRFDYYKQQVTRIPIVDFPATRYLEDGDIVSWQGLEIRYLDTPGYTRDGGTYVMDLDGRRVAFTGDMVLAGGLVPDLYSFQEEIPEAKVGGYHGYMGRLAGWLTSLEKLAAEKPDLIVPARGPLVEDPPADLAKAADRARAIYRNYLGTNALHWYFGEERMNTCAERVLGSGHGVGGMPFAEHVDLPQWCQHIGTTKLLVSDTKRGFVLDVGGPKPLETLKQILADELITGIDGIFATHTHNDHTQAIAEAARHFGCPVFAVAEVADVLLNPGHWFLPGISANAVDQVKVVADGQTTNWNEFTLTYRFFPGQMYNHGALLVEKPGHEPVFFIGDSFSPSGIDDYCLMNRNLMREDTGYESCFLIVESLSPGTWLVNQHIPHLFRFDGEELDFLKSSYTKRAELIDGFTPWDDCNFAIDANWASFYPYGQTARPGEALEMALRVWNHSKVERTFEVRLHGEFAPEGTKAMTIPARAEGEAQFTLEVPDSTEPGVHVITATLAREDGTQCEEWCEALVKVVSPEEASQ